VITELERVTTEKEFCDRIERDLREKGWDVLREAPVPGGRIDLLANRNGEQWVIEAKLTATRRTVAAALGQLLSYRHYRAGARLFFAAPVEVSDDLMALLLGHGIEVYS
jgi:Holliday junction resolvase